MSCDFAVWRTPSRLTNAEAVRLYHALCNGDVSGVSPSEAITAFYTEITSLHPEIDEVPDDRIGHHDYAPWSVAFDRSAGHPIMRCVWPKADDVRELVHALAKKHGLDCFDPQAGTLAHPDTLTLIANRSASKTSPSLADLEALAARMTSRNGPAFAILEGRGNDYVQVAGSGDSFTVEWREYAGDAFRHWKAGAATRASGGKTAILGAYLNGRSRPLEYSWRDMTEMFLSQGSE